MRVHTHTHIDTITRRDVIWKTPPRQPSGCRCVRLPPERTNGCMRLGCSSGAQV